MAFQPALEMTTRPQSIVFVIATNDVFIALCATEKVIFFSISTTIFQVVQANMRISSKSFLRHTYIGKHYNISA